MEDLTWNDGEESDLPDEEEDKERVSREGGHFKSYFKTREGRICWHF